jgi:outer membrane protein
MDSRSYLFAAHRGLIAILIGCFCRVPDLGAQAPAGLTLRQCIDRALEQNIRIRQARLGVSSAEIALSQARMSRYPNINGGFGQSVNFGRSVNPFDNTVVENQRVNSNNFSLSAGVNVFSGFQTLHTIRQRDLNLEASKADVGTQANAVVLGVVESFANVLSCQALVKAAEAQLGSTGSQLEQTLKFVEAGRLPQGNRFDLQAQLAIEETNLVLARNNLSLARLALAQWMQTDLADLPELAEPGLLVSGADEKSASEIYEVAAPNQPQIRAARLRVMAAEKGLALARSGFYPSISLQAGLFTNYSSIARRVVPGKPLAVPRLTPLPVILQDEQGVILPYLASQIVTNEASSVEELSFGNQFDNNLRKGVSLSLTIPIFNGFQNRYALDNARLNHLQSQLQRSQEENTLRQSIETAVANERAARLRLQAIEKQLSALEEAFRSTETRYNLGVLPVMDFILAKNNLARAQLDKVRFRYDFFIRRALLDFYLGKDLNFK